MKNQKNKELMIQILKFVAFSLGAGIIQTLTFALLNEVVKLNYWTSYLISLTLSVVYNFTVNRKFTFKSSNNVPKSMALALLFYVFFTPYSTWLTDFLTTKHGWNEYLVLFICMAQNMVLEFLWAKFVVYRNNEKPITEDYEENELSI